MGILALYLAKVTGAKANLLDGTGDCPPSGQAGYHTGGGFGVFNSMTVAQKNFRINEIKSYIWAMDNTETIPVDFIMSTYSWGFHYPVSEYKALALRSLKPGGRVVMDVRIGTPGVEEMAPEFKVAEIVGDLTHLGFRRNKGHRTCFERC